jgi:RNA polymerase sigma-70 factor (ECF subfamily)
MEKENWPAATVTLLLGARVDLEGQVMDKGGWGEVRRRVRGLMHGGAAAGLTDEQLLEQFVAGDKESAESAFAALVERHGGMVLRVCRGVVADEQDAQDAFQATFLILARKAGSLWVHGTVGPWLYGVARRTAVAARSAKARRQRHERRAAEMAPRVSTGRDWDDLGAVLHEEVGRLPGRYRTPVVLCYLEGLTHEQAAGQLGWPVGTVRTRLSKGRERLRARLLSRGLAPAAALAALTGGGESSAGSIPAALAAATVQGALMYAAGESIGGVVPALALALAERGLTMMSLTRWKVVAFVVMAMGGAAVGVVAVAQSRQAPDRGEARPAVAAEAAQPREDPVLKTLAAARIQTARSAINMLMDNSFAPDDRASRYRLFDTIPTWSHRLMEDQIRVAADGAGRVAAMREHRDRMKQLEDLYSELRKGEAGYLWATDVLNMKYHRLEAEQLLAEAGADPNEPAAPAQPEPKPAPAGAAAPPPPPTPTGQP